jgi:hypothetical protein
MTGILAAWLAEVGIISYRAVKGGAGAGTIAGLPLPSEYAASFLYYGALSLIPQSSGASQVGTALAWGMTIATFLNLYPNSTGLGGKTPITQAGEAAESVKSPSTLPGYFKSTGVTS